MTLAGRRMKAIAPPATTSTRATQGVLLMTLAMLSIPLVDGLAKHLSVAYSPLFIGWARYAVASVIVVPIAAALHGRFAFPTERVSSHILRTLFLVAAMTLYFLAIARIPLATAASAFFVGPIVAVVLSVVLLGERMTAGKAMALALGAKARSSFCGRVGRPIPESSSPSLRAFSLRSI
jgi:drug/metabolite transporter (DMT)-like permease